jgi:hypothetical protein
MKMSEKWKIRLKAATITFLIFSSLFLVASVVHVPNPFYMPGKGTEISSKDSLLIYKAIYQKQDTTFKNKEN